MFKSCEYKLHLLARKWLTSVSLQTWKSSCIIKIFQVLNVLILLPAEAVEQNDPVQLRSLLETCPFRQKELTLALQTAILKKSDSYAQVIQILLENGGDPESTDGTDCPFLIMAAEAGCVQVVRLLLGAGAKPDRQRDDGGTALHRAAWSGHAECVSALLAAESDTDLRDMQGRTPFLLAAQGDRSHVMELLLQSGCDPALTDVRQRSALYWAARYDSSDVIAFLLEEDEDVRAAINCQDLYGVTALMVAAERNHVDSIRVLLEHGADLHLLNRDDLSPLLLAARNHHPEAVRELALAIYRPQHGRPCDLCKCQSGFDSNWPKVIGCTHSLTRTSAAINMTDAYGSSALFHILMAMDDARTVQCLATCGADLDLVNKQQHSPLIIAVRNGLAHSLTVLLQNNANLLDSRLTTPQVLIREAVVRTHHTVVRLLYMTLFLQGIPLTWLDRYLEDNLLYQVALGDDAVMDIHSWLFKSRRRDRLAFPSLKCLTRHVIRRSISRSHFALRVQSLPIPTAMKDYLMLPELNDISH